MNPRKESETDAGDIPPLSPEEEVKIDNRLDDDEGYIVNEG